MIEIVFAKKPAPDKANLAGLWLPFLDKLDEEPQICLVAEGFHVQGKSCHVYFSEIEGKCFVTGERAPEAANILAVSWGAFCARTPEKIMRDDWPELQTSFSGPNFDGVTPAAFMMDMIRHLRFDSEFLAFFDGDNSAFAQFSDFWVKCEWREGIKIRAQGPDMNKVSAAIETIEKIGTMIYDQAPDEPAAMRM